MKFFIGLLFHAAAVLLLFGMTMGLFVESQHRRIAGIQHDTEVFEPFDGRLTSVTSEQTTATILVCVELIGELFVMLAVASFMTGLSCAVMQGICELFEALLGAVRRLFVLKRQPSDRPQSPDGDDDPGSMSMAKLLPPRPTPSLQCVRAFGAAIEDGKAPSLSSRVSAATCN